ncbi:iron-sulfur cluster assembly protein [Babesia microti strain RI]|uniref:Iron-sulfur cluster assembly protein n=1 Tax=Babesia microti (strain RI) TaxID=1133968 RepID=I7I9Q5_BABMR|nr:iron-sulfur cluster assembly protein [Babesia microti strain RI]CCF75449.1 iron-sulfur cluster assembly protein [Babesia microti strain RI]|eukprot:XP_012649857.1 iron-sulfur cluster assembly protein [Babesia microti strain RI]
MYNRLRLFVSKNFFYNNTLPQFECNVKYSYGIYCFATITRAKKSLLNLTDRALYEIRRISSEDQIVKLSIRVKGCNGYIYDMTLVDRSKVDPMDEFHLDDRGNEVLVVDSKAVMYVLGTKIDFEEYDDGIASQFIFTNPNIGSFCGCGMSFNITKH